MISNSRKCCIIGPSIFVSINSVILWLSFKKQGKRGSCWYNEGPPKLFNMNYRTKLVLEWISKLLFIFYLFTCFSFSKLHLQCMFRILHPLPVGWIWMLQEPSKKNIFFVSIEHLKGGEYFIYNKICCAVQLSHNINWQT